MGFSEILMLRTSPVTVVKGVRLTTPLARICLIRPLCFVTFRIQTAGQAVAVHGLVVRRQSMQGFSGGMDVHLPQTSKVFPV